MSERSIAACLLVASVYGGVWAVRTASSLTPFLVFLIVMSIWTVLVLWDQPQGGEPK